MASILTPTQIAAASQAFAQAAYVTPGVTANLNMTQITAGITAIDATMASSPASFASTYSGSFNVGAAFGAAVTAAVPGITTAQASLMLQLWCRQVTGVVT